MSIIIRLQNLPWSANSVDIRRFFSGLSIPEGGVHIVGGEMGDAFIAFSTDEDARLAMAKDGGKIKDMQIKLLLSSRTEMMRVIEQARQQNVVVGQPHMIPVQPTHLSLQQPVKIAAEPDRRRGRSPSPRRRSRDRSPARDRRRSPDDRRSKRERSRSPRGGSRGFGRDMDRRGDRFKREEKRYDDSRYRDERRSSRDSSQEPKKYFDADHVNSRSQLHATEGFRNMQSVYEQTPGVAMMYPFGNQPPTKFPETKKFPETYADSPNKPADFSSMMDPKSAAYPHQAVPFRGAVPFEAAPVPSAKEGSPSSDAQKTRRRTRFEPDFGNASVSSRFTSGDSKTSGDGQRETSYGASRIPSGSYPQARSSWPHAMDEISESSAWKDERQTLLDPPMSKNGDFVQVVPMDLEQSPSNTPEKEIYQDPVPSRGPPPPPPSYARNNASPRREIRGHPHGDGAKVQAARGDGRGPPIDAQGRVPPSMTVEVRGLPPDARLSHILDLFHDIPLPAANVRIEANDQGFEKAIIRFVSVADFEEALSRNRRFVHDGRCELVPCPADAFDNPLRPQKSKVKPKPREEDLTIQMRGLPFSCKEDDIVGFFDGLGILDLYVDFAPDGRASGTGFVEFGTHEDFRAALAMNGKMIGHRYITISVASKELMAFARGEDFGRHADPRSNAAGRPPYPPSRPSPGPNRGPVSNGRPPMSQGRQPPPSASPTRPPPCVALKGLPEGVTNRDIADFLGQVSVLPRAVHIMLRPDKTPSGDAFVEFGGPADMERALELNGKLMLNDRVFIQPISFHEMSEILRRPSPVPAPPAPPALLRTPGDMERARRPLLLQGPGDGPPFRERPRMEPPNRGSRPVMEPFKGRMDRPFGPVRMRGPRPYGIRPDGRFPPPPSERGPKDFGSPGSVVSINNLHFRAGLEELLDFFRDYHVTKDNILRKFNENNQTTGEARVSFQSPRDAQRAVRELNRKSIMGRPLSLSVL